jgi:IclR family acetate operon transcriptional repressor
LDTELEHVTEPQETGIQSVRRALDILELLGRSEDAVGVNEIGAATGLAAGTVHRLLATLTSRGYVHRNPRTRRYCLGVKAFGLATATRERLASLARPFLTDLMRVGQETANLAILEQNSTLYIEQVPAPRMLRSFTEPGKRVPLHSSGTGKVLLAYQPPRATDFIIERIDLLRCTPSTITDASRLREELQCIRRQGYAVDYGEQEEGVRCLAAPVFGPDGEIFAALSLSGPAIRLEEKRMGTLIPHLKRIASALSENFDSS